MLAKAHERASADDEVIERPVYGVGDDPEHLVFKVVLDEPMTRSGAAEAARRQPFTQHPNGDATNRIVLAAEGLNVMRGDRSPASRSHARVNR